jgi:hypothetical protein
MEINIMPYTTYTQQAIATSSRDEQATAQAELYSHLATQAEAVAPTQDPLTSRDRRIIGEIIEVEPESVRTIWIEGGITVWNGTKKSRNTCGLSSLQLFA